MKLEKNYNKQIHFAIYSYLMLCFVFLWNYESLCKSGDNLFEEKPNNY